VARISRSICHHRLPPAHFHCLVEISVGVLLAAIATSLDKTDSLGFNQEWLRFLASSGAVLLTFLAGAELNVDQGLADPPFSTLFHTSFIPQFPFPRPG